MKKVDLTIDVNSVDNPKIENFDTFVELNGILIPLNDYHITNNATKKSYTLTLDIPINFISMNNNNTKIVLVGMHI